MFLPCLNKVGIYVVYACYFSKLTFPSEFDSCLGGLGNLKLAMVGWGGCGPMWKVRNLNRRVTSFQRNLRGSSRYGVETSSYLKNSVFPVEILDTSGSNSTSHSGKFQNAHPTQARFKFSTPRKPFVSNCLLPKHGRQSNTRGLSGRAGGGGRGLMKLRIDIWAHYCAHSDELKR